MSENEQNIIKSEGESSAATIPQKSENEPTVPVKFNKQIKNLSISEAGELAGKGMKYDQICEDYKALKGMALKSGASVPEFLNLIKKEKEQQRLKELTEQTGGNEELSKRIMELEKANQKENDGFFEIKEAFPEINEIGELPSEVVSAAELKGTKLLDEYLRYLLKEKRKKEELNQNALKAKNACIGAMHNHGATAPYEAGEFIKGIWNR